MFRHLLRKFCRQSNQPRPPASALVSTAEVCISRASTLPKELRFCSKPLTFSCVAPVGLPLCILPCIGAPVPLYSGSLFGYQECGFSFSAICTRTPLHLTPSSLPQRAAGI